MKFGCHVDLHSALGQARAVGAEIAQITLGDPQSWRKPTAPEGLGEEAAAAGIGLYVHAAYVINVASTNNRIRIPSRKLLQQTIDAAAQLGAQGVIVHGGHVTADEDQQLGYANWRKCIDGLDVKVPLLIENTAGGNKAMMRYLDSMQALWAALDGSDNLEHVGLCLDTCHAHAAGLDLGTVVSDVRAITGRIDLVHCNDSADAPGSGRDRHAPWGQGIIDEGTLLALLRDANAPVVLETPAENHAAEIAWLRDHLGG
ncbi:MAG: deoxyribonuclease IV [Propionibacteriaceae bacterium]|nr:deoxyribonuclease IV [Propionibacteriaceae bacterium]